MRALPEQLGAAIPAPHTDVRIEIEHRVFGELSVPLDERRRMMQLRKRPPDRLVDAQRVGILDERRKQ